MISANIIGSGINPQSQFTARLVTTMLHLEDLQVTATHLLHMDQKS